MVIDSGGSGLANSGQKLVVGYLWTSRVGCDLQHYFYGEKSSVFEDLLSLEYGECEA